jgi:glycosyltransferase involved in cell wall biosynthesis
VKAPLFSVIIPTYDRPRLLRIALDSVVRQTVADFECIVVDDAGQVPAEPSSDGRVRVVRHAENLGGPAALNTGLRESRGRYVTFLDDDDLFTADRLALALEGLASAPIALCLRRGSDGTSGGNRPLKGLVHDRILDGLTPHLGQVAVNRSIVPGFDERFRATYDVDWLLRLTEQHPVRTTKRIGLVYRVHDGLRHGNGAGMRVWSSRLLLQKHARYFKDHPRATAFRWKRIGLLSASIGDHGMAREAFLRSLRLRPDAKTAWHLTRSIRPSVRTTKALSDA